jgi:hypothetical protein
VVAASRNWPNCRIGSSRQPWKKRIPPHSRPIAAKNTSVSRARAGLKFLRKKSRAPPTARTIPTMLAQLRLALTKALARRGAAGEGGRGNPLECSPL